MSRSANAPLVPVRRYEIDPGPLTAGTITEPITLYYARGRVEPQWVAYDGLGGEYGPGCTVADQFRERRATVDQVESARRIDAEIILAIAERLGQPVDSIPAAVIEAALDYGWLAPQPAER